MTPAAIERHLPMLSGATPPQAMRSLIGRELDRPPLPGGGATLERWRILAAVGGQDLSLLKLYEGHTDAIAILHELEGPPAPYGSLWGVWCAESPEPRLELRGASVDVRFQDATARQVGAPYAYLHRAGLAHGAIGVAAGWYGAACAIGERLHRQLHDSHEDSRDALRLAQLGGVDVELGAAGALLRLAAAGIDRSPGADVGALEDSVPRERRIFGAGTPDQEWQSWRGLRELPAVSIADLAPPGMRAVLVAPQCRSQRVAPAGPAAAPAASRRRGAVHLAP
jgi:hypothetical protein